jgi:hypothetical protein
MNEAAWWSELRNVPKSDAVTGLELIPPGSPLEPAPPHKWTDTVIVADDLITGPNLQPSLPPQPRLAPRVPLIEEISIPLIRPKPVTSSSMPEPTRCDRPHRSRRSALSMAKTELVSKAKALGGRMRDSVIHLVSTVAMLGRRTRDSASRVFGSTIEALSVRLVILWQYFRLGGTAIRGINFRMPPLRDALAWTTRVPREIRYALIAAPYVALVVVTVLGRGGPSLPPPIPPISSPQEIVPCQQVAPAPAPAPQPMPQAGPSVSPAPQATAVAPQAEPSQAKRAQSKSRHAGPKRPRGSR